MLFRAFAVLASRNASTNSGLTCTCTCTIIMRFLPFCRYPDRIVLPTDVQSRSLTFTHYETSPDLELLWLAGGFRDGARHAFEQFPYRPGDDRGQDRQQLWRMLPDLIGSQPSLFEPVLLAWKAADDGGFIIVPACDGARGLDGRGACRTGFLSQPSREALQDHQRRHVDGSQHDRVKDTSHQNKPGNQVVHLTVDRIFLVMSARDEDEKPVIQGTDTQHTGDERCGGDIEGDAQQIHPLRIKECRF